MYQSTDGVLNPERLASLRELCDDEEDLVAEIAELYLGEMPGLVERLAGAVSARDCGGVRELAHRIKGASGNIGADGLALLFARIESAAVSGTLDAVAPVLVEINNLFPRVCDALAAEIGD